MWHYDGTSIHFTAEAGSAQPADASLEALFNDKLTTPDEAVRCVKSGDTVYIGTCTSTPYALCDALGRRGASLEDVRVVCSNITRPTGVLSGQYPKAFRSLSFFMGPQDRAMYNKGLGDCTSIHLSQVDLFCTRIAPADAAFIEVSLPDDEGYMSFGATGVALHPYVCDTAKRLILQINPSAPYVLGEHNLIHISKADSVVWADEPIAENPTLPFDDTIAAISALVVEQVPDGACVQLGLGGVATAVGFGLREKNDLGGHTELMTDPFMDLMKRGVMTNRCKKDWTGKTVASFTFGSRQLYRFIDHNRQMHYMPFPIVNDPRVIARNDNMISINTALAIDLFGQVNAESIGPRTYSGVGGQLDFVIGSQLSRGGKSFIAVTSTYQDKKSGAVRSRIVPFLPTGTPVTTPRAEVQYVVTEYGCVNLKNLPMRHRVAAMISLAHPDFRGQLKDAAREAGIL